MIINDTLDKNDAEKHCISSCVAIPNVGELHSVTDLRHCRFGFHI